MELTSPAFGNNQPIPDKYTHRGAGVSPPLTISGVPLSAQTLVLIMHDPDAPAGDFVHWVMWNVPADLTTIVENSQPAGTSSGFNDFNELGYGAPAPPSGTHHYVFDLYALDLHLGLGTGTDMRMLRQDMEGKIIAQAQLIGTVSA